GIQVHYIQTRSKFGKSRFLVYPCFSKHLRLDGHSPASVKNLKKRTSVSMEYLTIDAGQDEMFDSSARPGILFALHSPYEPVNPYLKGALMKPGRSYQVHIQLHISFSVLKNEINVLTWARLARGTIRPSISPFVCSSIPFDCL
ncbi:hypothetical protein JTE90_000429, partial [Oedothorax gibbosus]